jgi:hypothetical protein
MMRRKETQAVEARASAARVGRRIKISSRISSARYGAGVAMVGGRQAPALQDGGGRGSPIGG